jgi:hypothetical protein
LPTLRAATDPAASGGQYFGPDRLLETRGHPIVVRSSRRSQDRSLQARLWRLSEQLTDVTFPFDGDTIRLPSAGAPTAAQPNEPVGLTST